MRAKIKTRISKDLSFIIKHSLVILMLFCAFPLNAQSLSFDDLINLQKSDLEKVKGFFSYKGWTWSSSTKNVWCDIAGNGYNLNYDYTVVWKINSETVQYLSRYGFENGIWYYTNYYHFQEVENAVKGLTKESTTYSGINQLGTEYKKNGLTIRFNISNVKEYYSTKTSYVISVFNRADVDKYIAGLCSTCNGYGEITEYKDCWSCSGYGKQGCYSCSGKGMTYCAYCKVGKTHCSTCYGNMVTNCTKCYGHRETTCTNCYGHGATTCTNCYGQGATTCVHCRGKGTITDNVLGYNLTVNCKWCSATGKISCSNCSGKGKFTCSSCSGKGKFTCSGCSGKGTLTCSVCSGAGTKYCTYCKGNYSSACSKCSGKGRTDVNCTSCNGTGKSSEQIKKTCPTCNGTKMK